MDGLRLWERTRYLFVFPFWVFDFLVRLYVTNAREEMGREEKEKEKAREGKESHGMGKRGFVRYGRISFISFHSFPHFFFGWDWNWKLGGAAKSESERIFEMYEYLVTVSNCLNK